MSSPYSPPARLDSEDNGLSSAARLTCVALASSGFVYALLLLPVFWFPIATVGFAVWVVWISIAAGKQRFHRLWFWFLSMTWHFFWLANINWQVPTMASEKSWLWAFIFWHSRIHTLAALLASFVFTLRFTRRRA